MAVLIEHEAALRFGAFIGVFLIMFALEVAQPLGRGVNRRGRWRANLGLTLVDAAALRLAGPIAAFGAASYAQAEGVGLLHVIDAPLWFEACAAFLVLDLAIYVQHRLVHQIPILWRLHRVHHTDRQMDVTTGLRFHPAEIVLSMGYKALIALALGAPPEIVVLFEIILNAASLFTHAAVRLPAHAESRIRLLLVTPEMHRVHHTMGANETKSNYGFFLSIWDRLFGSYNGAAVGQDAPFRFGVEGSEDVPSTSLLWCLRAPFGPKP
ncbi:MAG: sterol desaturase family protein [Pseudomonadota bacterium]